MRKAALHNLGCKVNAYEAEVMAKQLENAGYEIVDFHDVADVYIINTCSVTNIADRKSRQMLHKAKKMNPDAIVVAAGCYVQTAGEQLLEDNTVDMLIGNNKKNNLVEALDMYFQGKEAKDTIIDINHTNEYEDMVLEDTGGHTRAYIKIQDGCNQFCSYCIIPYARGRIRSRSRESIQKEVNILAKAGYKEIVLTGIHLSSYGKDFNDGTTLIDAIEDVSKIEGIERIRLGSLEPRIITEEFAERLSKIPQICPHFHLSLQSGCQETLKRMNRHYTPDQYYEGVCILRKYFNNPAIATDVIVGFPDESEEEFKETKKFLEKVNFAQMHIFKYSRRKGTRADKMPNQVPDGIKGKRSDELLELEKRLSKSFRDEIMNKSVEVLFEEEQVIDGKRYFTGYTKEYVRVAVETGENLENQLICVKAVDTLGQEIILAQM